MTYASLPDHMTTCNQCQEAYTDAFDKCPNGCIQLPVEASVQDTEKPKQKGANSSLTVVQAMNTLEVPIRLLDKNGKPKTGRNNWSYRELLFDSKDEALRYGYLADMQAVGVIRHLCVQPTSVIRKQVKIPATRYYKEATLPAEKYTPDYAYVFDGMLVIEDVKGPKSADAIDKQTKLPYKRIIPYSKSSANRSHKHLMDRYQSKLASRVLFMLVVRHGSQWRYYQASTGFPEIEFSLEVEIAKSKVA